MRAISILIACALFIGCSKQNSPSASMTAQVNNTAFQAIGYRVVTTGGTTKTIVASNLPVNGNPIATSITITVPTTMNTYQVDSNGNRAPGSVTAFYSSAATNGTLIPAVYGTVKITNSTSSYFQGTFSFTFAGSSSLFVVSDGQFTGTF